MMRSALVTPVLVLLLVMVGHNVCAASEDEVEEDLEQVVAKGLENLKAEIGSELTITNYLNFIYNADFELQVNATDWTNGTKDGFLNGFVQSLSVILVSELGDKTFFIAAIMSMTCNRLWVFLGGVSALGLMTVLSAGLGFVITTFIPRAYTYYASTAIMFLFGFKMMWDAYKMKPDEAKIIQQEVEEELKKKGPNAVKNVVDLESEEAGSRKDSTASKHSTKSGQSNKSGQTGKSIVIAGFGTGFEYGVKSGYENEAGVGLETEAGSPTGLDAKVLGGHETGVGTTVECVFEGEVGPDHETTGDTATKEGTDQENLIQEAVVVPNKVRNLKVFFNCFLMTFLAEWGDRSQLATIVLASQNNVFGVCVGGVLGHAGCTGLAVLAGALFARWISVRVVTFIGALVFLGFATYSVFFDPDGNPIV